MAVRTAAVLEVAQAAAADRGRLLRLSRPATWLVAGMPFLVGALAAERGISLLTGVGLLYFLAPFALLRGGLRDIHAPGNDPDRPDALATRFAVAVINLPFLFVLALAGGPAAAAALLLTVALVVAEAAPPARPPHPTRTGRRRRGRADRPPGDLWLAAGRWRSGRHAVDRVRVPDGLGRGDVRSRGDRRPPRG